MFPKEFHLNPGILGPWDPIRIISQFGDDPKISTQLSKKQIYTPSLERYEENFQYIRKNKQIEDVVISGGDVSLLKPDMIRHIAKTLLDMEHVRRIRFATKSLAVFPDSSVLDRSWFRSTPEEEDVGPKSGYVGETPGDI